MNERDKSPEDLLKRIKKEVMEAMKVKNKIVEKIEKSGDKSYGRLSRRKGSNDSIYHYPDMVVHNHESPNVE